MPSGYGMGGHIMCQFQNSFGTVQTDSLSAIPVISESMKFSIEDLPEQNLYGRFTESPIHQGKHLVDGGLSMECEPSAIGWFLKSVLGQVTTTSDTGIQTHLFTPSTPAQEFDCLAANKPMNLEVYRDVGSAALYSDCVGNDFSLNIANGQLLTMDVNFIGAGFTRKEAATPSFPTGKPFIWDQSSVSFAGAAVEDMEEVTINFNNNLEPSYTLQKVKTPRRIKRTGFQQIEISGSLIFASHAHWQIWEAGSEYNFTLHFTNAQSPHLLTMVFPRLHLNTFEPQMADAGLVKAAFTGKAMYDVESARACHFTLVNTQTYY